MSLTQVASELIVDGAITPAKLAQKMTQGTVVATTSGTEKIITGIPSWAKRVTIAFQQVSVSGTANLIIQVGPSSGAVSTGYVGGVSQSGASSASGTYTQGLELCSSSTAASSHTGVATFTLLDAATNTWVGSAVSNRSDGYGQVASTVIALSGVLDRIRFTTTNGTDTFDAGSVNVIYEG